MNRKITNKIILTTILFLLTVSCFSKSGSSNIPIMSALIGGNLEIVRLLYKSGANINTREKIDMDALIFASQSGHLDIVKFLVENGANINAKDGYNDTALRIATEIGHWEIVKHLMENGENVNANASEFGITVLCIAFAEENWKMFKYLIEKWAILTLKIKTTIRL